LVIIKNSKISFLLQLQYCDHLEIEYSVEKTSKNVQFFEKYFLWYMHLLSLECDKNALRMCSKYTQQSHT